MDKAEFIEVMRRVEEAVPDKASPEILSLIIANLVLLFEQHAEWPQVARYRSAYPDQSGLMGLPP